MTTTIETRTAAILEALEALRHSAAPPHRRHAPCAPAGLRYRHP